MLVEVLSTVSKNQTHKKEKKIFISTKKRHNTEKGITFDFNLLQKKTLSWTGWVPLSMTCVTDTLVLHYTVKWMSPHTTQILQSTTRKRWRSLECLVCRLLDLRVMWFKTEKGIPSGRAMCKVWECALPSLFLYISLFLSLAFSVEFYHIMHRNVMMYVQCTLRTEYIIMEKVFIFLTLLCGWKNT